MPTRHDYREQAARYDRTRGASPSILGPLVSALEGTPGSAMLDVAGGTGNYAEALRSMGFEPTVLDLSEEMLERARSKGLAGVRADASRLPIADESFDAVVNVSALHLIPSWREALGEARRVLKPGGRLALMVYTRENLDVHWVFRYFPETRAWVYPEHQTLGEIMDALPGATVVPFEFTDLVDASMSALCRRPELLLDPDWRMQTSFFERLRRAAPAQLAQGLSVLERDLANGVRPDEDVAPLRAWHGDGTIIGWAA
jgi:demethylmenaquinone methyltransferase/2-methoxy-6-polyprenyl-1,4-benzoquinol methylase